MSPRKVLLDECVDRGLAEAIAGHEVKTVPEAGWASLKNGELLSRAQDEFDVFVTTDRNLMFQQNLPNFGIAVLVLSAKSNRLRDLLPLLPKIVAEFVNRSAAEARAKGNRCGLKLFQIGNEGVWWNRRIRYEVREFLDAYAGLGFQWSAAPRDPSSGLYRETM